MAMTQTGKKFAASATVAVSETALERILHRLERSRDQLRVGNGALASFRERVCGDGEESEKRDAREAGSGLLADIARMQGDLEDEISDLNEQVASICSRVG